MPGNSFVLEALLSRRRHLEYRLHLCGDVAEEAFVHGRQRDRLNLQDFPSARNASRELVARCLKTGGNEVDIPKIQGHAAGGAH